MPLMADQPIVADEIYLVNLDIVRLDRPKLADLFVDNHFCRFGFLRKLYLLSYG
jgi:hypothetical protein